MTVCKSDNPISLLQVVNSFNCSKLVATTGNKQCEHNLSTACEQICNNCIYRPVTTCAFLRVQYIKIEPIDKRKYSFRSVMQSRKIERYISFLWIFFLITSCLWATTKKRYSDTTIQRYRNRNLEPEPGTMHNLCKLEHFAQQ
jgi:hypothetical protein